MPELLTNGQEDHEEVLVLDEYRKVVRRPQKPDWDTNLVKCMVTGEMDILCRAFVSKK